MIKHWQSAAFSLAVSVIQAIPALAQDSEKPYLVTRECVERALEKRVPLQSREFFRRNDSITAASLTESKLVEFVVHLSQIEDAAYVGGINLSYADQFNRETRTYEFSAAHGVGYIGDREYPNFAIGPGEYDARAAVKDLDNELRGCLAIG